MQINWCTGILSEVEFNFVSGHLSDGPDKVLDTVNKGIMLPGDGSGAGGSLTFNRHFDTITPYIRGVKRYAAGYS